VIPPRADELTGLFVRYWDNNLSRAESDQFHELLASDSTARELFHLLSLQAVAAAENTVALNMSSPAAETAPVAARQRPWSRRQLLGYLGGGVAAGIVATLIGRRFWLEDPPTAIQLTATSGDVRLRKPGGGMSAWNGPVPEGGVVSTVGPSSSAMLTHDDGTTIALAGDSAVGITDRGRKVTLFRGAATASVPARPTESEPLTLATTGASVSRLSSVVFTIYHAALATEVGVQTGRLTVADAVGEPLEVVHGGEYLTIESSGRHRKQSVEPIPDSFALDLTRPLPKGWAVGVRDETEDGPMLLPVLWFDPFHQAQMFQIRSDHRWAKGFVSLRPDSKFRIKYWVEKPGASQFCMCVRTNDRAKSDTGMLERNGAFERARPREWQWLEVRAEEMRDNKHAPKFNAPWIPFLLIFNTYSEDLGLKIADVRVA
jgi:ferric-dicitrate binding protein FerR (iron transport regulator)